MEPNQRLKYERELKGWSQQKMAEMIGTTTLSISRWECGITVPKPHFRHSLSILFDKSIQELGLLPEDASAGNAYREITLLEQDRTTHPSTRWLRDPAIPTLCEDDISLVGRDTEFHSLKQAVLTHRNSFAIHGLPGIGKTALAISLTCNDEIRKHFCDGILWVGLGREPNIHHLLSRWGILLGLTSSEIAKFTSLDMLATTLRDIISRRHMLLIIDDAWKIKAALDFKIGGMDCSHLVTTRFPPIALQFAGNGVMPIRELSEEDSFTLLKRLAPQVVTDELSEARELAHSVRGLPLALTLMGNYLRIQAYDRQPRRIYNALERLRHVDTRLQLAEAQALSERNTHLPFGTPLSLQAAIEISDQQLDQLSQNCLRALSIFPAKPNSFSEMAAMAICGSSGERFDILTDAGLLESHSPGRYTLHQTIVDYAKLNLTDQTIEEKMVLFFVSFVETHHNDYDKLERELNNILAAFEVASSKDMARTLQQGVNLLAPFLEAQGLYSLAELYLKRAQQAALPLDDGKSLALTQFHLARTAELRGDLLLAEQLYLEGLRLTRKITYPELLSSFLSHIGEIAINLGDCSLAEQYLLEGLELASTLEHQQLMSSILSNLGKVADSRGDIRKGTAFYKQGLELARNGNDWRTMGASLQNLGVKAEWGGNYVQANAYYQEGLACAQKVQDRQRISAILMNMGILAFRQNHYQQAEKLYLEALELAHKMGNHLRECSILQNLGTLESIRKNYTHAEVYLQESLDIAHKIGHAWLINEISNELGELFLKQWKLHEASAIFCNILQK